MPEPRRRKIPADVARTRARLAGLTLRQAAPDVIGQARADLEAAKRRAAVRKLAGLPAAERAELAVLLLTGGGDHAAA